MIGFYLKSVVIWMIILECNFLFCRESLRKRFPVDKLKETSLITKLKGTLVIAAIPIVRLIIVIVVFFITFCNQEDFDEIMKKANKE